MNQPRTSSGWGAHDQREAKECKKCCIIRGTGSLNSTLPMTRFISNLFDSNITHHKESMKNRFQLLKRAFYPECPAAKQGPRLRWVTIGLVARSSRPVQKGVPSEEENLYLAFFYFCPDCSAGLNDITTKCSNYICCRRSAHISQSVIEEEKA